MVFKSICVMIVLWMKVALALEWLKLHQYGIVQMYKNDTKIVVRHYICYNLVANIYIEDLNSFS